MERLPPGQAGIQFRRAWLAGDAVGMADMLDQLDGPHLVELVLGAALRDGRGGFAAARALGAGVSAREVLPMLVGEPDTTRDEEASAWITARVAPAEWRPGGAPLGGLPLSDMASVARAYGVGIGGAALLAALSDRPLHAAVVRYYATSTLFVLGPRPLFILAAAR